VTTMTYRDAVREALREALASDERVFFMGEDIGRYGGAFAVSHGLLEEFGPERVRDAPLSESAFVGAGIGAALAGMRPIVEVMTINFSLLALDQVVNNAATIRYMSGGQFSVPLVVRMATGGGRQLAAQHAHSLEAWYAHVPGIKALSPATVADARWMLPAALEDPDPVFLFEHATLYPLEGEVDGAPVRLGEAAVVREGRDVTLVTAMKGVHDGLEAAAELEADGVSVEVVDLRTLRPFDLDTVLASVRKTNRMVVVEEGPMTGGWAGEVLASVVERGLGHLDDAWRIATPDTPIPYSPPLEDAFLPGPGRIAQEIRARVR